MVAYECGDGWRNLIDVTIDQVVASDPKIQIKQVKEKFGGLRIYYSPHNNKADYVIRLAEEIAAKSCMSCGKDARIQKLNGSLVLLCASCYSVKKKK